MEKLLPFLLLFHFFCVYTLISAEMKAAAERKL
jgi:hypothetical protein